MAEIAKVINWWGIFFGESTSHLIAPKTWGDNPTHTKYTQNFLIFQFLNFLKNSMPKNLIQLPQKIEERGSAKGLVIGVVAQFSMVKRVKQSVSQMLQMSQKTHWSHNLISFN